jgi:transposase InsO family protein
MAYPDVRRPYRLYTDACDYAIGGILVQTDDTGVEKVIQYISHQLSSTQRRWATIEKEAYAVIYAITKLRTYLFGADFVVLTDHKPLKSLFTKEMANTKVQRWAVLLAEYGAKIEYREGKNNIRADMLSRIESDAASEVALITESSSDPPDHVTIDDVVSLDIDNIDKNELIRQQKDEFTSEWQDAEDEATDADYSIVNGVLCSELPPYPGASVYPRIMITKAYRQRLIQTAHEELGHLGATKTQKRLVEAYVWPGLRKGVREYIRLCPTCEMHHRRPVRVAMQEVDIPPTPMQMVGLDLIGPFTADQGYKYLLTAIDYHSGWAEAMPMRDQSAAELIRAISTEFIPRHGHPRIFLSDNGQGFGSLAWETFLAQAHIKCQRSTPAYPQGNGKIERLNRTIKDLIAKLVRNKPSQWLSKTSAALAAYRNAVSNVTGFTPFYLLYGRRSRVPLEALLSHEQSFGNRLDDLAEAYRLARTNNEASRRYNRANLQRRANVATSLSIGDTVTVKAEERVTNSSRWDPQWEVYRVRGTTHWIRNQNTGRERKLHRVKLTLVDPDIVWDEVPERPRRQFQKRPSRRQTQTKRKT